MPKKEIRFRTIIIFMIASLAIAGLWDKIEIFKNSVHYVLDPSAGALLDWNLTGGMLIIVIIISLLTTIIQKYTTDQEAIKKLKVEQKALQVEMKKFKDNQPKLVELQKKQFESMPRMMKLNMGSIVYTGVPFVLFIRWFMDYFTIAGNPKFFGFLTWFWFYLIFVLIFSGVLKKVLKVD